MESQAVREAGERARQWRELENRTAPGGDVVVVSAEGTANKVQYFLSLDIHRENDLPSCGRAFGASRVLLCSAVCKVWYATSASRDH